MRPKQLIPHPFLCYKGRMTEVAQKINTGHDENVSNNPEYGGDSNVDSGRFG